MEGTAVAGGGLVDPPLALEVQRKRELAADTNLIGVAGGT